MASKKARAHRLELHDRNADGERHRHRWAPRCSCGRWFGLFARTKKVAADRHRDHVRSERRHTRVEKRAAPRPVTPEADLPEALRRP